jgi:putative chitinase
MITADLLVNAKLCDAGAANKWAPYLDVAAEKFGINTPARVAGWLAQCGHESGHFRYLEENLNYSADRLQVIFGKYFTPIEAAAYARQPERIANRVYANRLGNGSELSGDGFKYHGRGLIQLTGKSNYKLYGEAVGAPEVLISPELLTQPQHAAMSAAWFWASHKLNEVADTKDVEKMTRIVNGGTNGLAERKELYAKLSEVLLA